VTRVYSVLPSDRFPISSLINLPPKIPKEHYLNSLEQTNNGEMPGSMRNYIIPGKGETPGRETHADR